MKEAPSKVLVLGAGGVGAWVAKSLKSRGHDVLATTTQVDTDRALTCLGVEVLSWRWSPGTSWADLEAFGASHWVVTVPPRAGKEHVHAFHEALNASAQRAGVSLLVWTSSTAVYDPNQTGSIGEGDAGRHLSRHTGLSMLDIEDIHRHSAVPFVALRFGGLFSSARHPAWALSKRTPVQQADGMVQWVHEEDAANACVHVVTHDGPLASAYNVVAPDVCSRRAMLEAAWPQEACPVMEAGGVERRVLSDALESTGFNWTHPSPRSWVAAHAGVTTQGHWKGPHGRLHWTCHSLPNVPQKGVALMVHGYKGFREWGNWKGVAERWARLGWTVYRMDFSHNGHCPPFLEDCVDEEAWSQNHHHFERDEVAFALKHLESMDLPVWVMGHSRGGAAAALGAAQHSQQGGSLHGVVLWAPVSDHMARFPSGDALEEWKRTDRLEVVHGRTGQTLVHPFQFYEEAMMRQDDLDVSAAIKSLTCPLLVLHGDADPAVSWIEGRRVAGWAPRGTFVCVEGADHVFGMKHPWGAWTEWPPHLEQAWSEQEDWMVRVMAEQAGPA